jgi:hypothetical protein
MAPLGVDELELEGVRHLGLGPADDHVVPLAGHELLREPVERRGRDGAADVADGARVPVARRAGELVTAPAARRGRLLVERRIGERARRGRRQNRRRDGQHAEEGPPPDHGAASAVIAQKNSASQRGSRFVA